MLKIKLIDKRLHLKPNIFLSKLHLKQIYINISPIHYSQQNTPSTQPKHINTHNSDSRVETRLYLKDLYRFSTQTSPSQFVPIQNIVTCFCDLQGTSHRKVVVLHQHQTSTLATLGWGLELPSRTKLPSPTRPNWICIHVGYRKTTKRTSGRKVTFSI